MTETNHRRKNPKTNPTRLKGMQKHSRNQARCDNQARSKYKRITSRNARRKDKNYIEGTEDRKRSGKGTGWLPKNRK